MNLNFILCRILSATSEFNSFSYEAANEIVNVYWILILEFRAGEAWNRRDNCVVRNLMPMYMRHLYVVLASLMIFSQSPTLRFFPYVRNRAKGNNFFREIRLKYHTRFSLCLSDRLRHTGRRNKSAKPWLKSMPRGRLARIERGEVDGLPSERKREEGRKRVRGEEYKGR